MISKLLLALPMDFDITTDPTQPPGTEKIGTLINWLTWGGLALCVAGLLIGGATMAIQMRRGEGSESLTKIGFACLGAIVIGAAASIIGALS